MTGSGLKLSGRPRTIIAVLALLAGAALFAQGKKPRIAVLPFDSSHISSGYAHLSSSVVNGMFETQLVKTQKFTVVERKRIEEVLQEQGLGASGAVDATTAAKIGRILGVELILVGDITKLGVRQSGGGGLSFGASKNTLEGGLDVRLVNTSTAEIVFAETAQNEDSSFKVRVFGAGGGVDFDETKIDKVFRPCVEELSQKMAAQAGSLVSNLRGGGLEAKIANVSGDKIYLNKGASEGVKAGDVFDVFRVGREIKDPDTGAVLDVEMTLVGRVVVKEVKDKVAIASPMSGSGFQGGDVAKPAGS